MLCIIIFTRKSVKDGKLAKNPEIRNNNLESLVNLTSS